MYIEYVLCVYTLVLILVGSCRLADACIQYVCMNFYDVYIYNNIYIYYPFIIEVIVEVVTIRHCTFCKLSMYLLYVPVSVHVMY